MYRAALVALVALVALPLGIACSPDTPQAYPSYQECFDDRVLVLMDPVEEGIVTCCLDHEINGVAPSCGADQNACVSFLTNNLFPASADTTQVRNACIEYENLLLNPPPEE
jgi:hypothetical protein